MLLAILSGFVLALLAPWIHRASPRSASAWLALLPAALALYFAALLHDAAAGSVATSSRPWAPALGVDLAFSADGLSALFAVVISAVGALVLLYSGAYLRGHPQQGRLLAYLLAFMASMLGLVLADDMVLLFVFWELTSLTSYLLIGFHHEDEATRASALKALLVTSGGGLALLAGFVVLKQMSGTFSLSELAARGAIVREHPLCLPALILVLIGAFTKSAQFPFHFWLPSAMVAPTPVSAYLHSATMVKAGIYLLARLSPVLGGTQAWSSIVPVTGAVTLLLGAWLALLQSDLKRLLAYSTVSALGSLTLLLGAGSSAAVTAALVLLIAHVCYKGALFLVAGIIDHELGTRDVELLSGLRAAMPLTAAAGIGAALSMAGLPPLLGHLSKELVYASAGEARVLGSLSLVAAVLSNVLLAAVAAVAAIKPFLGAPRSGSIRDPSFALWLGPALLAALGVAGGLFAGPLSRLVAPAVASVVPRPVSVDLALWHGFNRELGLSVLTLAGGGVVFALRPGILRAVAGLRRLKRFGPEQAFDLGLRGLNTVARVQTRLLQNGSLRHYVKWIVVATVALTGAGLVRTGALEPAPFPSDVRLHELAVAAVVLSSAMAAAVLDSRLAAVVALGAVGYGVAMLFVLFGAPDLALTQFSVETLTVILFLLVVYRLPPFLSPGSWVVRLRDATIAVSAGVVVSWLVLAVTSMPGEAYVSEWFAKNAYALAHGRNVVNVILVDFRALDTLGEITVLAVAAVGVFALTRLRLAARQD